MVPRILYKFMDPSYAKEFFSEGGQYLNLAPIRSLNDPFEFTHSCSSRRLMGLSQVTPQKVDDIELQEVQILKEINRCLGKEGQPPIGVNGLLKHDPSYYINSDKGKLNTPQKIIDDILARRSVGVLSMSADKDGEAPILQNPLMWAHYCEKFQGFAIAIDTNDSFFSACNSGDICTLKQVRYKEEMPLLGNFSNLSEDEIILNIGTIKSHHWRYENEWRLIATSVDRLLKRDTARLKRLPICAIKGVYIGVGIDNIVNENAKYMNDAIRFCKSNDIPIYSMLINTGDWGVSFRSI